ncbi:MAG TPA: hypothetical protein VGL46_13280 [Pseudonocardiaceae bacterium]|jgi:hypothetical protein
MPLGVWPPTLDDIKADADVPNDTDDATIANRLASAVVHVRKVRPDLNYDSDPLSCLDEPDADVWQGTVMLTVRLLDRQRSPDGMIAAGDLGVSKVAWSDPDISRLLSIGPFVEGAFY